MLSVEFLFTQADDTDFNILRSLTQERTYPEIAEHCYISETAAKYRIKKTEALCGVDNRKALISLLAPYLQL